MEALHPATSYTVKKRRVAIVTPVFNDWESLARLCLEFVEGNCSYKFDMSIFAIDDGSSSSVEELRASVAGLPQFISLEVVRLASNLGHQRAIAVGLAEILIRGKFDCVVVMDADGEDSPKDVERLLAQHETNPDVILVAKRSKRSEGSVFRVLYHLYKAIFIVLTGQRIDFGNFCLIPCALLVRIVHMPETWNHLAGSIVKSKCPVVRVETERAIRYAGTSKMNLVTLVAHGLSAIAVFGDIVFTRALILALGLAVASTVAVISIVGVRLLTELAIPGWASTLGASMLIILFQALTVSAGAAFMILSNRSNLTGIPALDARRFVQSRTVVEQPYQKSKSPTLVAN